MIDLIIPSDSIEDNSKQIFSEIYFAINENHFFPGKGWTDFTAIILNRWLNSTISAMNPLKPAGKSIVSYDFMDGPYCFTLQPDADKFHVSFVRNGKYSPEIKYTDTLLQCDFFQTLMQNSNQFLRTAQYKGLQHNNLITLQHTLTKFQTFYSLKNNQE